MLNKNELQTLTPTELLLLQKHIKQGKGHLEKVLTHEEMKAIFRLAEIPSEKHEKLETDLPEQAGVVSLVLNTIMTATLGAWMGLSGFLGLGLDSPKRFLGVLSFAVVVGAFIGYQNVRMTRSMSRQAIEQRKLQDFELAILHEVARQRKEELREKRETVRSLLVQLGIRGDVEAIGKDNHLPKTYLGWIEQVDQNTGAMAKIRDPFVKKWEAEERKKKEKQRMSPLFDKLSHSSPSITFNFKSWIRSKSQSLLVGLIPVLFGGFSSLFVYMGGGPKLAEEMEVPALFQFLNRPEVKEWQLAISICITLYFGFCFVYLNRKAFLREEELAKTAVAITREEKEIDLLDDQLLKIKEALEVVKELFYLRGRS